MAEVTLSSAVRASLLTLQRPQLAIDSTQTKLATGQRVSSALDNAAAFFAATGLTNRADDLSNLKDDIDQGISAIEAAINGVEAVTELGEQAKGLAVTARATCDTNERSSLAVQFDALLTQIDTVTNDSGFSGTNLIKASPDNLVVSFNESGSSTLTISGIDTTTAASGLNVTGAVSNFAADSDIEGDET